MTVLTRAAFTIEGEPIGKARPRFNRFTGNVYTPRETAAYEDMVAWHGNAAKVRFRGPVSVTLAFRTDNKLVDLDNLCKAVFDGLQRGTLLANDRQVRELHARFVDDGEPRAEVTVEALNGD